MSALAVLPNDTQPPKQLGSQVQSFFGDDIRDLDPATAHWVYFIPSELMARPVWKTLRVRLTHAGRCSIVFGNSHSSKAIVQAMRDGASDFIFADEPPARWIEAVEKAAESQKLWIQLYGSRATSTDTQLVGKSAAVQALLKTVERVGPTPANVLITGESGTGKERVACALHEASGLAGPYLPVNCAAIPRDLLESELFGVEKGAFTGAAQSRPGLVEQAAGGTLFLDEIGELDASLQPKLLRFLESRRARRVGGNTEYMVNARIVSATNRDLEQQIEHDQFRADLFYRLSEIVLKVAPLRNHAEDIPMLADHFLAEANEKLGKNFVSVEPALLCEMMEYPWPGNVRELRTNIHRLAILHDGPVMRREWWEAPVHHPVQAAPPAPTSQTAPAQTLPGAMLNRRQKYQRARELLDESGNDQTWTAAQLGIHPTTLFRWIKAGKV
ncbi:MAG: sigma-54 dependent transcriptional regulator [Verrucomicrobiota bacterium]